MSKEVVGSTFCLISEAIAYFREEKRGATHGSALLDVITFDATRVLLASPSFTVVYCTLC